ncbi:hypothetical protein FOCG_18116 [Fusarium oxysporum f. sp. radicis-lycopersici 26381]|nr:hypothetical protein FOCG_18116 [Fusarium oxysporum f. sp. radicis-lycopersici 26381]
MDIPVSLPLLPRQIHWAALHVLPRLVAARKHKDQLIQIAVTKAKQKVIMATDGGIDGDDGSKSAVELVIEKEYKAALKEGRPADYDSSRVKDELFGFLLAGHETGSTTIEWWIKLLTKHQDIQHKLRSAIHRSFEQALEMKRQPSIEDITTTSIPYLDAFMEEAHRVSLIAPLTIRLATKDTTVLGHLIPAGTDVFLLHNGPGAMMKDIDVDERQRSKSSQAAKDTIPAWKEEDRAKFIPERWLSSIDSTGNVHFNPQAGPAIPFGAGPRACFGEKWARLEVRIIIILILWNFELQKLPERFTSWEAIDGVAHRPKHCYIRLRAL